MAVKPIFITRAAQEFRAVVRPDMFGNIANIEPRLAMRAANDLNDWLFDVVKQAVTNSEINSRRGDMLKQLLGGIRIYGRSSLAQLRGQVNVQPWIFSHEYGADILPGPGKQFLTVPFAYALRPDGSPKFRSANSWKRFGSFIKRDKKNDKLFIVYKSASGELRYLYTLVDKVHIPARLKLNQMADSQLGELMAAWGRSYLLEVGRIPDLFMQWLKG